MEFKYKGNSRKSGVYQIRNVTNDKVYIGSAKCFKVRANQHLKSLVKGVHQNKHLQNAFNKDGTDNFVFEVLEVIDGNRLIRTTKEQEYIDNYLNSWELCYNIKKNTLWSKTPEKSTHKLSIAGKKSGTSFKKGQIPWNKGKKGSQAAWNKGKTDYITEETRKRISLAVKNRIVTEETKQKMSDAHKGRIVTEETRKRIGEANRGRSPYNKGQCLTEEHKKKISEANIGRESPMKDKQHTEETKQKMRESALLR